MHVRTHIERCFGGLVAESGWQMLGLLLMAIQKLQCKQTDVSYTSTLQQSSCLKNANVDWICMTKVALDGCSRYVFSFKVCAELHVT